MKNRYIRSLMSGIGLIVVTMAFVVAPQANSLANEVRVIELTVKDRRIDVPNNTLRIDEGDNVELRITSDETGELHLHGYDIKIPLEAGQTAVIALEAKVPGRFPVSAHGFGKAGAHDHGHKPLLYLEVYPR